MIRTRSRSLRLIVAAAFAATVIVAQAAEVIKIDPTGAAKPWAQDVIFQLDPVWKEFRKLQGQIMTMQDQIQAMQESSLSTLLVHKDNDIRNPLNAPIEEKIRLYQDSIVSISWTPYLWALGSSGDDTVSCSDNSSLRYNLFINDSPSVFFGQFELCGAIYFGQMMPLLYVTELPSGDHVIKITAENPSGATLYVGNAHLYIIAFSKRLISN